LFKVNRDGYSLADFQREREAMVTQQRATYDPQPEIEGILDRMCAEYLHATPQEREQCRSLVSDRKAVLNALLGYVHSAAKRVSSANDIDHLRLGLAAASIENCATDYRDDLVALAGIWVAAERAGIDPSPYFRAVAKLSSDREPRGGEAPVSEIMNNLQDYAVVSEYRATQGEWPPDVLGAKNKDWCGGSSAGQCRDIERRMNCAFMIAVLLLTVVLGCSRNEGEIVAPPNAGPQRVLLVVPSGFMTLIRL
jgi:hypothetical protein